MITQFVPEGVCVKCEGCCRFSSAVTPWAPCLLDTEIKSIPKNILPASLISPDKKIILMPSGGKDIFLCPFFDVGRNKCGIYSLRPFECRLYPFIINRRDKKIFLAVDLNCDFARENLKSKLFKEYVEYLIELFKSQTHRNILKDNSHIIQTYAHAFNLEKITI